MRNKLASSIAILLNYGAKWRLLYYIFYVLCLDLELSIVLDKKILAYGLDTQAIGETQSGSAEGIGSSVLGRIAGFSNITAVMFTFSTAFVFAAVPLCVGAIALAILLTEGFEKKVLKYATVQAALIGLILSLDYWLELLVTFQSKMLTCRIDEYSLVQQETLQTTSLYVPAYWGGSKDEKIFLQVYLPESSKRLICWSLSHVVINIINLLAIGVLAALKFATIDFETLIPTSKFPFKLSHKGMFHQLTIVLLLILKPIGALGRSGVIGADYYFPICLGLFGVSWVVLSAWSTYLEDQYNRNLSLKVYFLLFAAGSVYVERFFQPHAYPYARRLLAEGLIFAVFLKLVLQARKSLAARHMNYERKKTTSRLLLGSYCMLYIEKIFDVRDPAAEKLAFARSLFEFFVRHSKHCTRDNRMCGYIAKMLTAYVENESFSAGAAGQFNITQEMNHFLSRKKQTSFLRSYPEATEVLETMEESREREFKKAIKLLGLVLHDVLLEAGGSYSTLPKEVVCLFVYYHLNYSGRIAHAASLLYSTKHQDLRKKSATDLRASIMKHFVRVSVESLQRTSSLVMAGQRGKISFNTPQACYLDFSRVSEYCLKYEQIKKNLLAMIDLKLESLEDLDMFGANLKARLISATKFTKLAGTCESLLKRVKQLIEQKSTPVKITEYIYAFHVVYDFRRALWSLRSVNFNRFTYNFTALTSQTVDDFGHLREQSTEDLVVLGVSAEHADFHSINYVSTNVSEYLSFQVDELMNEDLAKVIPKPLKSKHHLLMDPQKTSGIILESKRDFDFFLIARNKSIKQAGFSVKPIFHTTKGINFIARLTFRRDKEQLNTLIFSKSLLIQEISAACKDIFDNYGSLSKHGQEIEMLASRFVHLRQGSLRKRHVKAEVAEILTFRRWRKLKIVDREKNSKWVFIKFDDLLVRGVEEHLYYLHVKESYEIIDQDEDSLHLLELGEFNKRDDIGSLTSLAGGADQKNLSHMSPDSLKNKKISKSSLSKITPKPSHPVLKNLTRATSGSRSLDNNEISQYYMSKLDAPKISASESKLDIFNEVTQKKVEVAYDSLVKILNRSRKKAFATIREMSKNHRLHLHPRVNEFKNDLLKNERNVGGQNTDGSVKLNMSIRSDTKALFSRYLVTRREELSTRGYFLFLVFTTYLMVASAFGVGYWFIKMNTTVKTEILLKAKIMDTASWAVWAVNSFTTIIDTKRLVYEDIIPLDFFADWGIPDLLDNCNQQKALYWHMLLIYSGSVDVEMNTLKMPNFKPDTASGKTSSYTLLQPSLHDPSSAAFKNKTFHSLSGLQYIQPYINEIIARNDSDTSTGVELDPLEDLLRFNLHNSLQVVAIETSQQVNSYSTNITRFAAWCAYLLQFAPLAIMLLTMLAATGIVGLFNLKLKKRLVKTLQFKVDDDDRRNKSWTNA